MEINKIHVYFVQMRIESDLRFNGTVEINECVRLWSQLMFYHFNTNEKIFTVYFAI